jgi:hypothetical protein
VNVTPVPVFGQLYGLGYANLTLRSLVEDDGDGKLPEAKLGWEPCWLGIQVMLITLLCGLVVALIGAPLFMGQDTDADTFAPALVYALQGPSSLLISAISAVLTAIVTARFALTRRFGSGFDPVNAWRLLRAEPAIWISCAVIGYIAIEGPYALAWALPLHGGWDTAATIFACTVLWIYGQMINVHLISQAYAWSSKTAARSAAEVRYRW